MGLLLGLLGMAMMMSAMGQQSEPPPIIVPAPVDDEGAEEDARKEMLRRRNARANDTLLTGPGGLQDEEAEIAKNTLLTTEQAGAAPGAPEPALGT